MALTQFIRRVTGGVARRILGRKSPYGFTGSYTSWADAVAASDGYDHTAILDKVTASGLQVKRGEAAYERDPIAFKESAYVPRIVETVQHIASEQNGRVNIIDFGGSLGSTYLQHREILKPYSVSWNVVEQPAFVARGKEHFQDATLKFFGTIDEAVSAAPADTRPNAFFALSSLQYLQDPYAFMSDVAARGFDYILIDRTPCMPNKERITVQKVPARIYGKDTSYPAWILNETKLLAAISTGAMASRGEYEQVNTWNEQFGDVTLRGWLLKKQQTI